MVVLRLNKAILVELEIDSKAFLLFRTISKRAYENKILIIVEIPSKNKNAAERYVMYHTPTNLRQNK